MDAVKDTESFRTMVYHYITLEELCAKHEIDLHKGLTDEAAAAKIKVLGPNKLSKKKANPWYCMFLKTLLGFFSLLLWTGSFLCLIAYGTKPESTHNTSRTKCPVCYERHKNFKTCLKQAGLFKKNKVNTKTYLHHLDAKEKK
ncbi:hypothetical protein SteCoe_37538 [Stentor coeruleus]|uniref:Cation-transporting P-type ATPase N-terminal domain-containing protein n=1 Tax=Stentor coeruleus TaxID=5963 RepID=A0A1R2AMV1_9CILI|nr:hypothetical protein SteCoe_37538 [Stentor coeruleus]